MKINTDYCNQVNKEWSNRAAFVPYLYEKTVKQRKTIKGKKPKSLVNKKGTYIEIKPESETPYMEIGTSKSISPLKIADNVMQQLELVPYVSQTSDVDNYAIVKYAGKTNTNLKQSKLGPPSKRLNFQQMRDFIKTNYVKKFTWGDIVIENKCIKSKPIGSLFVTYTSEILSTVPTRRVVKLIHRHAVHSQGDNRTEVSPKLSDRLSLMGVNDSLF